MLCFLSKSSCVKNFDLSSVLSVDPVTCIMTNITFFFLLKFAFIARYIWRLCECHDMVLERTSKSVTLGMLIRARHAGNAKPKWLHDRPARHAKPDEQKLGMNHKPGERSGPKFS